MTAVAITPDLREQVALLRTAVAALAATVGLDPADDAQPNEQARLLPEHIRVGALHIDTHTRTVALDGRLVRLKAREFDVLAFLAHNVGAVFSRERLIERLWAEDFDGDFRTVDVHIRRIRRAIGHDRIETLARVGYRLRRA